MSAIAALGAAIFELLKNACKLDRDDRPLFVLVYVDREGSHTCANLPDHVALELLRATVASMERGPADRSEVHISPTGGKA